MGNVCFGGARAEVDLFAEVGEVVGGRGGGGDDDNTNNNNNNTNNNTNNRSNPNNSSSSTTTTAAVHEEDQEEPRRRRMSCDGHRVPRTPSAPPTLAPTWEARLETAGHGGGDGGGTPAVGPLRRYPVTSPSSVPTAGRTGQAPALRQDLKYIPPHFITCTLAREKRVQNACR